MAGRPKGTAQNVTPAAAAAIAVIKTNIRLRLDTLGVTAGRVANETGHTQCWLSDLFLAGRYEQKLSVNMVADIADALGVEFADLCNGSKAAQRRVRSAPPPAWHGVPDSD
jgi:hypothetical protein